MSERRVSDPIEKLVADALAGKEAMLALRDSLAREAALRAEIDTKDAALAAAEGERDKANSEANEADTRMHKEIERRAKADDHFLRQSIKAQDAEARADKAEAALDAAVTANAEAERRGMGRAAEIAEARAKEARYLADLRGVGEVTRAYALERCGAYTCVAAAVRAALAALPPSTIEGPATSEGL